MPPRKTWQFESRVERGTARGYPGFGVTIRLIQKMPKDPLPSFPHQFVVTQKEKGEKGSSGERS
jgi:hypothetical protein